MAGLLLKTETSAKVTLISKLFGGAGAIETAVFGTSSASFFQSLPKRLPRPVAANFQIILLDAKFISNRGRFLFCEFKLLDQLGVFRFQRGEETAKTLAQRCLVGGSELCCCAISCGGIQMFGDRCAVTVVVNDGIVQHPIEPGYQPFMSVEFGCRAQALEQTVLQDILGDLGLSHAFADVTQEALALH